MHWQVGIHYKFTIVKCDPVSKKLEPPTIIEFKLEAILSVQVIFQLNLDYHTNMLQGACTISY